MIYTIFVPSGDNTGDKMPVLVNGERLGLMGNRNASARLTTSLSISICFSQFKYPSLEICIACVPRSTETELFVAVTSLPSINPRAPIGSDVADNSPVGLT